MWYRERKPQRPQQVVLIRTAQHNTKKKQKFLNRNSIKKIADDNEIIPLKAPAPQLMCKEEAAVF